MGEDGGRCPDTVDHRFDSVICHRSVKEIPLNLATGPFDDVKTIARIRRQPAPQGCTADERDPSAPVFFVERS